MRRLLTLFLVIVTFGLCDTAFAQLACSVASTPVSRAIVTGLTQPAGDITFICNAVGNQSTGDATFEIDFGKPITNSTTYPPSFPIALQLSGSFAALAPSITSVTNGIVTIHIPAQAAPSNGLFTLTGVLLDLTSVAPFTFPAAQATISVSPGRNVLITAGQNDPTVITTALPGLATVKLTPATSPATLLVDGTAVSSNWSVDIPENYIDAFASSNFIRGSTNGVGVSIRFTGIPGGVTFGGCSVSAFVGTSPSPGTPIIVGGASTVTSVANRIDIDWASQPSFFGIDTLRFGCTAIAVGPGASLPLNVGTIGLQATLAPSGSAFGNGGSILMDPASGQIPRYAVSLLPAIPLTIAKVIPFSAPRRGQITSD
jgi:hypothetical protein